MDQKVAAMKPQIGFSQSVDSFHYLRKFSLKKYKNLSKLKIVNPPFEMNQDKKFQISLKFSTSTKGLKYLDLSQYHLKDYNRSQIKLIAKKFHRIIRLSFLEDTALAKNFLLAKSFLKKAKNLSHLSLKNASSNQQLRHLISKSKLIRLDLMSEDLFPDESTKRLNFSKDLPSRIEGLSLYWRYQIENGSKLNFSINHLANLQKFELKMPLGLNVLATIIKTIQDPSKLKTLQFHLVNSSKKESFDVHKFLGRCLNLEEMIIRTNMNIFPSQLHLKKLKKLSLESNEVPLAIINFFEQQKKGLETLNLTTKLGSVNLMNRFLGALKSLKKLKRLKLNVKISMDTVSSINVFDLVEALEELECLEEVDFTDLLVEFRENNFRKLCRALQKRAGTLKSLKLSFNNWSLNQKSMNVFCETLTLLSKLEHITLKDFAIEDASFYSELREIVCCKNLHLNEVIIREEIKRDKPRTEYGDFIRMLKDIIHKPTMKILCYLFDLKEKTVVGFKDMEISPEDIRKDVHHFDDLKLPSFYCKLDELKWRVS